MSQGCGVVVGDFEYFAVICCCQQNIFPTLHPLVSLFGWVFICQVLLPGLAIWVAGATPNVMAELCPIKQFQFVLFGQQLEGLTQDDHTFWGATL